MTRRVVFHYHLFKNAGTSVDKILKDSFPDKWATREFKYKSIHTANPGVETWISENPEIIAFASHTARLPVPEIENTEIFPVIFVRHPLLRIYSGYIFETTQDADTPGSRLAKANDFPEYLDKRMKRPKDATARNFQATRIANLFKPADGTLEARAMRALEILPFLGLVEQFEPSMSTLKRVLARRDLNLVGTDAKENVSSKSKKNFEGQVKEIRKMLGSEIYKTFESKNKVDLKIHNIVRDWYGA